MGSVILSEVAFRIFDCELDHDPRNDYIIVPPPSRFFITTALSVVTFTLFEVYSVICDKN